MRANIIELEKSQPNETDTVHTPSGMMLCQVFNDRSERYLNKFMLYVAYFNTIPNYTHEPEIDCEKANAWFLKKYSKEIRETHSDRRFHIVNRKVEYVEINYVLHDRIIVQIDFAFSMVRILYLGSENSKVEALVKGIRKFKSHTEEEPEIYLLVNTQFGIDTRGFKVSKLKLNIEDNYNDDFSSIHQNIVRRLSKKDDKGLVLLHGKPGTGKSSYIRYLISAVNKKVIFLPPNMATELTNPGLISVLMENQNSIFVIEDAENIIMSREKDGQSPVATLLNISDGLLSECLNIQVICSFNTDISKVDSALLRKGRLIAKYEFLELSTEKAAALSAKLGFKKVIDSPMTLTDIYNQEEPGFNNKSAAPIGFLNGLAV